ncbi:MAG: hypothetical protein ACTHMD_13905 [Flavisolibacter sp.]
MLNNKFDLQALQNIIQDLRTSVPKKQLKHYNLNTVENFILYFNTIKDINKKKLVYKQLSTYLDTVKELDGLDGFVSIRLFNEYFDPITKIYTKYGFAFYPGHDMMIIILVLCLTISYLASSVFVSLSLLFIFSLYCIWLARKKMQKRIYGYGI